ncbi:MAG: archaeosortase A [Methanomicrobiaceae archaeon]|nr:archaeosortase A [Methanomicrobiaceae archaeon]
MIGGMNEYLLLISCIAFLAFLIPNRFRKQFAIVGWLSIVGYLFTEVPYFISINNFFYPTLALLSIPFLYVTIGALRRDDSHVLQLSTIAAVAFLIFAPFAYIEPLGNWLISVVTWQTSEVLNLFGYPASQTAWNILSRNDIQVEIILACTAIQSIAIMLGVACGVQSTLKQKFLAFVLVSPTIYILNIFRNVFVITAYTEQWFPYLPDLVGTGQYGYESFFWAHNVISELLALVALIGIAYGLFALIPQLASLADGLYRLYRDELGNAFRAVRQGRA